MKITLSIMGKNFLLVNQCDMKQWLQKCVQAVICFSSESDCVSLTPMQSAKYGTNVVLKE